MKHRILMSLCLTLFSTLLCAKPIIIIDAGSTGTRLYVYDVNGSEVKELQSTKIQPGLSELTPNLYGHYFRLLLDSAKTVLDDATKAETRIYLYATAGVRMLPATQQDGIFNGTDAGPGVRDTLKELAQTFGYPTPSAEQIRTISGTEEGMFIWMSDNYLHGSLKQSPLTTENTIAALEMGGASTEIAFLSNKAEHYTRPLHHQGLDYRIYSYGYDGLGANKALARMQTAFSKKKTGFPNCFPVGAPIPMGANKPQLTGEGNFSACVKAIKQEFIDNVDYRICQAKHGSQYCSSFAVYQPPVTTITHYLLTDGFYHLFNYLKLPAESTQTEFLAAAKNFCSSEWSTLEAQDPNNPYVINYCFNAALTKTMLDAMHVKKTATLHAANTLEDRPLAWPQGAALSLGQ